KLLAQLKKALEQLQKLWVADQRDAIWVGNERCLECHEEYGQEGRSSLYALYTRSREILLPFRRGCEGCHGPGSKHAAGDLRAVTNPRNLTKARIADLCLSCHTVKRLVGDPDFHLPGHSANHVGCLNCHSVHHPAASKNLKQEPNRLCLACHGDIKAQLTLRSRHPVLPEKSSLTLTSRSDKVLCIDCHRPYTRTGDSVGREPQQATCQRCHPDTRGPFLFGHDGGSPEVSKGCTTCHLPHGSPHRHLLRMQGRSLCVSCHTDQATTHYPGPSCTVSGCHQSIHGSNLNQFFLK
ncbi:MAG: cytochrome c3 family protein, partial [Candidatus Riflebacteria bacterium]|nr:cytochrome c3 family protein [Candidatus Riflebacteria bacterium]